MCTNCLYVTNWFLYQCMYLKVLSQHCLLYCSVVYINSLLKYTTLSVPKIKILLIIFACNNRFLEQKGVNNIALLSRMRTTSIADAAIDADREEGLYATYAMLHTHRRE